MSRRSLTVRQLAIEHALDLDEALVTLWDAGFDEIEDIDHRIPHGKLSAAHRALGIGTLREMRTVAYWEKRLGVDGPELQARLAEVGVRLSPAARVLPKGALAKLRGKAFGDTPIAPAAAEVAQVETEPLEQEPACEWRTVGTVKSCQHLSLEDVKAIHQELEREFAKSPDPVSPPGVRDAGLLESAIHRAETSLGDVAKYPTSEMVAAALLHSLIHNHPFFNGNKRTALVAMLASLDRNGRLLTCNEQTLFRYVLRVAQHRLVPNHWSQRSDREVLEISDWICDNSRLLGRGERRIKWRELRRNLTRFGCTFEGPLPGNRMNVRRVVTTRGRLGRTKRRELIAHAWYGGDGREVKPEHVHVIRERLQLDDAAGYDSAYFYGTDPRDPDEFIGQYRTILRRLAKL